MASSVKATNKMENRDIYWIKEMIENGEIKFNEGVGASDNPIIFRFEEDYIVQADEFLYMDKHLDIRKIDTLKAFNEIEKVCDKLFEDKNNKVVDIDNYLGLEARMCIDCLFVNHGINFLEYDDYYIDAEHNFIRSSDVMNRELINKVVNGLRTNEFYTYLNAEKESLNEEEKLEIANQMRRNIYCYENWGIDYYFTLSMLIEDFYRYISSMTDIEDDMAYMSFSDYMEHFGVEEYKFNK